MAVSKELVEQAVKQLNDVYDLKGGKIDVSDNGEYMLLKLNNNGYTIYPTDERDIDDIVSFIAADQNLQPKTISKVVEKVNGDINECVTNPANIPVFESTDSNDDTADIPPLSEDYPALLVALDSEKDAEVTYKTLIEIEKDSDKPNQQVIDLLEKILADELEHIALLSALSANKNSEYVAEDSQKQFNEYIDDVKSEDEDEEEV